MCTITTRTTNVQSTIDKVVALLVCVEGYGVKASGYELAVVIVDKDRVRDAIRSLFTSFASSARSAKRFHQLSEGTTRLYTSTSWYNQL